MKRNTSCSSSRDENLKSTRSEDSKSEEERLRRRREWMIQQEREREHERLKKKMIIEYEIRRAREKGLPLPKGRLSHRSRSKSHSRSPENRRRSSVANVPRPSILSEKLQSSDGTTPLFKGPEGTLVSATELRRIKVDIHRNIPGKSTCDDLQRDILNPEDVVLKRREGEGSKPIFEREEIKAAVKTDEVEEHRTVIAVHSETLENESRVYSKYAVPTSPVRNRSCSPRPTSSHHSRGKSSKHDTRSPFKSDRELNRSGNKSIEFKDGNRRHRDLRGGDDDHSPEKKFHRDHSRSREREARKRDSDSHRRSFRDERYHREYRDRSRDRSRETSRERRDRDRSRERRVLPPHYIEQIPVPIYCGNFSPRPIMLSPMVPVRGHVPMGGNRHFPIMGPMRPFSPRFGPPDMYRLHPSPNPRFRPMY